MTFKKLMQFLSKKKKKQMLFFHYLKYFSLKQPKHKQIVICFDGLFTHGGWVDRLKGIVSFYQIAQELGYDFKILFDNPFNLSTLLAPNVVDWELKRSALTWHPTQTKCLYLVNNFKANPLQLIKTSKANTFYVYANIDYSKATFPKLDTQALEQKWRADFNALFKKSELLDKKLKVITSEPYIAFHSRFTTLMGDFVDTTSKVLSVTEKEQLSQKLLAIINRVKAESNINTYVFSDSINFINYIKQNTTVKVVEGNPFHMDNFTKSTHLEGHLKTVIDFFMIANSENVYFLNVKPMYNSSFSKYAAIIGNTDFQVLEA
ncbi:hypothetical protein [Olleya aquimaris]|uniref:Uncharacterized protein n=1 Tax=Olleya aquimaris TaxID=639310 RepID=A0A327RTJ9_9FLAO|nr:hypothetical protein [Olleya aquimaris]RAJ16997.1 hypothetical protein LY08_00775 [Olleya aquimaris]